MTAALLGLDGSRGPADPTLLARVRAALTADEPPTLDVTLDALLPVLVELAPQAVARHRALGLGDEVSRDTLGDVGRKVRLYGTSLPPEWLVALVRADVVTLGRLQFSRVAGPRGHAVHLPEFGPLSPALVDEALARATDELGATAFTCRSWLLDPFLAEDLPADANIVRFAARFAVPAVSRPVGPEPAPGDLEVARFVFRRPLADVLDPARVTPRTSLERVVVRHLRAGDHWTEPEGVAGPVA